MSTKYPRMPMAWDAKLGGPDREKLFVPRVQMMGLFGVGAALVAIPLYFWRRPTAEAEAAVEPPHTTSETVPLAAPVAVARPQEVPVGNGRATLAPFARSCSDGSAQMLQTDCGALTALEKNIERAVQSTSTCVPSAESGSVTFVVNVDFRRHLKAVSVATEREGRTLRVKVARQCAAELTRVLRASEPNDPHDHPRYRLSTLATYAAR